MAIRPWPLIHQVFVALGNNFHYTLPLPQTIDQIFEAHGHYAPWLFLGLFVAGSFLMVWRLRR